MKFVAAKCPNCGAQIQVDKNSNSTICEFCDSQIFVEEAIEKHRIEVSGSIEINNLPKLENYLKLGERHYNNGEYEESYEMYSKAIELDPDNYISIMRRGFSKSLCTNYKKIEIKPTINGIKNAYDLLKKENDKEKINNSIIECSEVIKILDNLLRDLYNKNLLNINELEDLNNNWNLCLETYEFLYTIIVDDDELRKKMIKNIISVIDNLLLNRRYKTNNYNQYGKPIINIYILNMSVRKNLVEKKQKYNSEYSKLDPNISRNDNNYKSKTNKNYTNQILNIFKNTDIKGLIKLLPTILSCFVTGVSLLFAVASFFAGDGIFITFSWLLVAIIFAPPVKSFIVTKYKKSKVFIILARIILVVVAFCATASSAEYVFENTWTSDTGMSVILKDDQATVKSIDGTELNGNYTYEIKEDEYIITVNILENNVKVKEYKFRCTKDTDNIKFNLLENDVPTTYFKPENPNSSYIYVAE